MALVRHVYGRAITFRYTPIAESEAYVVDGLVSARLYGPNAYPTDAQIEDAGSATTGHIGSRIESWSLVNEEGTGSAEYKIVFDAVPDTTPTRRTDYDLFYVALNYQAESGGPVLQDVEQIVVYRPDGLTSKIRVSAQDVYGLESKLEEVAPSQLWTEDHIDNAIDDLLNKLEGRGYEKRRLFNLEKLNGAAARLGCSYACLDRYTDGDESWRVKAEIWEGRAYRWFDTAKVGIDAAGDDLPDPESKVTTGAVVPLR